MAEEACKIEYRVLHDTYARLAIAGVAQVYEGGRARAAVIIAHDDNVGAGLCAPRLKYRIDSAVRVDGRAHRRPILLWRLARFDAQRFEVRASARRIQRL